MMEIRRIGHIDVVATDVPGAVAQVVAAVEGDGPAIFGFCNAHSVNLARADPAFVTATRAGVFFNDGSGVDIASRLLYGMAKQEVLPPVLGRVHATRRTPWVAILFTTAISFGLIYFVSTQSDSPIIKALGGTTALLLLGVFYAATDGVLPALISRLVPAETRGSGIAAAQTAVALTRFASSLMFGVLWTLQGPGTSLVVFAVLLAAAIPVAALLLRGIDRAEVVP